MKKKLGFFCLHFDPPIGGAERSMRKYFESISSNLDIQVFCFLQSNGMRFTNTSVKNENGIKITQSAEPLEKCILKYITTNQPNFLATQLLWSDPVIALASKYGIPCYYFAHGLFEDICQLHLTDRCSFNSLSNCDFGPNCPNGIGLKRAELKYSSCKKVFVNSQFTKDIFNRFFPNLEKSEKIDILYPFVDIESFKYKPKNDRVNKRKILAVNSNFTKGRNLICEISQHLTDYEFVVVNTKDSDIEYFKSSKNIKTLGTLNTQEMFEEYFKADVVIVPSLVDETFSLVACEAILCGTPVVASQKGNLPNLIIPEKTGFIVNNFNVWDWSEAIEKACNMTIDPEITYEYAKFYNPKNGIEILNKEFGLNSESYQKEIFSIESKCDFHGDKQKILFLAKYFHPPLGGGEYFLHKVLKSLQSEGYNVVAGCYSNPDESFFREDHFYDWEGIPVFRLAGGVGSVENFVKKCNPDLVITQSFDAPRIIDAAKSVGAKTILGTHFWRNICEVDHHFINMLTRDISSVKLLTQNHRAFFDADEVYVNSKFMQMALKRFTKFECKNIIHPIIDLERVLAKEEKKKKYITLVNPDEGKGGGLFVELATRLKGLEFLCVGQGKEFFTPNRNINLALKKLPNVTIVESTKEMSKIYEETKILLVPSKVDETFSMVALEAMFNGIPVLASGYGNLPYLIEDSGFNLPVDDVLLWEETIDNLNHNKEMYDFLSKKAIEISKKYLPEIEKNKFIKLVNECLRS